MSTLMVVDGQNRVIAHTDKSKSNSIIREDELPGLNSLPAVEGRQHIFHRITVMEEYGRVFLVARPCMAFQPVIPSLTKNMGNKHSKTSARQSSRVVDSSYSLLRQSSSNNPLYLAVVGLNTFGYNKSLLQLRFQALMLSLAILLVGLGGWLSLSAVQGYQLSQKALSGIQAFTGLLISRLPVGIMAISGTLKRALCVPLGRARGTLEITCSKSQGCDICQNNSKFHLNLVLKS